MPSPNQGMQAAAIAQVVQAVRVLERALPMLGSMTDAGQTVMKAIQALAKIAPEGASSPGVETTALRDLMQQNQAQAPMLQLMRSMGGGGAAGAPPQAA